MRTPGTSLVEDFYGEWMQDYDFSGDRCMMTLLSGDLSVDDDATGLADIDAENPDPDECGFWFDQDLAAHWAADDLSAVAKPDEALREWVRPVNKVRVRPN